MDIDRQSQCRSELDDNGMLSNNQAPGRHADAGMFSKVQHRSGDCPSSGTCLTAVAKSSDRMGRAFHGWRESPERRSDSFASLGCLNALGMRIILDAFEHQSTKSLSIARLRQWGPTWYDKSGRKYPMTFSIAKGSCRRPTASQSDKPLGTQYMHTRKSNARWGNG
jgi:hypothetical protein